MSKSQQIIFLILFLSEYLICQETSYGPGYQTLLVKNPAFAGASLDGTLRLSYLNFYPGNQYNLHSFFLSYDSFIPSLHGGAGLYLAKDHKGGIVNDLRGGLSYSYFLQAGRDLYINAGLSSSFFHRGFDFSQAVFPDQIDQMGRITLPAYELMTKENVTLLDIGAGFMFFFKRIAGGFAMTHLTQPYLDGKGSSEERLSRKYVFHLLADLDLKRGSNVKVIPLISIEKQGSYFCSGTGAVLMSNNLSVSSLFLMNNNKNIDLQAGLSYRIERIAFFYNYRFNIVSGNTLLPFTLIHQTGLALTLNGVEKRIKVGTINVPYM
jgi:type IX secretion system PorP/SprF family membrane protein